MEYAPKSYLYDKLLVLSRKECDYNWVQELWSWDSGDCSYHGLLSVALMREYEIANGGIFGTKGDVKQCIENLNKFIEGENKRLLISKTKRKLNQNTCDHTNSMYLYQCGNVQFSFCDDCQKYFRSSLKDG